uniref:Cyclic nucleotide-gated cation channel alpha-3 n=1 Tax=Aceria tosichella TaxID=561515 RepID=A0A6G1SB89_9ACAR
MSQEKRTSPAIRALSSPPTTRNHFDQHHHQASNNQSLSGQQQQQVVTAVPLAQRTLSDDAYKPDDLEAGLLARHNSALGGKLAAAATTTTKADRKTSNSSSSATAGSRLSSSSKQAAINSNNHKNSCTTTTTTAQCAQPEPTASPPPQESSGGGGLLDQFQVRPGKLVGRRQPRTAFINPSGTVCYWWSAVVSLAFLYNFWAASYRFAFREIDSSTVIVWMSSDLVAEMIYWADILMNRRTGYLEDGVLQRDPKKIRAHYHDSNLLYLDFFCVLPFDILYLSFGYQSIFRCNRLVKIYKFWSFVDRTERHTNYPNVFRTVTLVHNILVIFHWNACIFHTISTYKIIDIEGLYKIDENHCKDTSCQYLHAFYWSTLAIIGDLPRPKTKGEYIYVIVELIFGLILFAWVLGHVANIVTNVSAARKEFQARLDAVKTFMRTRRVSDELQTKVIRWFDYLWSSQKSTDEERSVACLPDRLKAEIAIHVNLDTLKRVDIFRATEVGFLRDLVLRLKPVLFSPGDYVCRKDEAGHEMYIVSRGILEVVTNDGQTVVATFTAGSYFGEIAVLNVGSAGNKRTASVRSVGYSDLFCLSKQDLWDVLKDYPQAEARIRSVAEERLSALSGGSGRGGGTGPAVGGQEPAVSLRRSRTDGLGAAAAGRTGSQRKDNNSNTGDAIATSTSLVRPAQNNRRSSQRSNRSRVQPTGGSAYWHETKHLECLSGGGGGLFPPSEPPVSRLRPYGSSSSYRSSTITGAAAADGGSQFLGRKCLNSRTMEPICNAGAPESPRSSQAGAPMMMFGSGAGASCFPVQSEPQTQVHHCHHRHPCHHAGCGLYSSLYPPEGDIDCCGSIGKGCGAAWARGAAGSELNLPPPASPRQMTTAGCETAAARRQQQHLLSVQQPASAAAGAHLGQSRSFECSPLGLGLNEQGPGGFEFRRGANRSRSGALLASRATPPNAPHAVVSDDNQTLVIEQATSLDGDSSTQSGDTTGAAQLDGVITPAAAAATMTGRPRPGCHRSLLQSRQHQHRAHLCMRQVQQLQQQLSTAAAGCRGQLRERSSSMNTRPANESSSRPSGGTHTTTTNYDHDDHDDHDDYFGCDVDGDVDEDEEYDERDGAGLGYKWTLATDDKRRQRRAAGSVETGARRQQRHRRECRHHFGETGQAAEAEEHSKLQQQQQPLLSSPPTTRLASGGGRQAMPPPYGPSASPAPATNNQQLPAGVGPASSNHDKESAVSVGQPDLAAQGPSAHLNSRADCAGGQLVVELEPDNPTTTTTNGLTATTTTEAPSNQQDQRGGSGESAARRRDSSNGQPTASVSTRWSSSRDSSGSTGGAAAVVAPTNSTSTPTSFRLEMGPETDTGPPSNS